MAVSPLLVLKNLGRSDLHIKCVVLLVLVVLVVLVLLVLLVLVVLLLRRRRRRRRQISYYPTSLSMRWECRIRNLLEQLLDLAEFLSKSDAI
jgi:Flp pilus assembly protein TadB